MKFLEIFFKKDGQWSKTAIILSVATFIVLFLYTFQSLLEGTKLFDSWVVPEFSPDAAFTILVTLASLYVANHRLTGSIAKAKELKDEIGSLKEKE